MNSIAKSTLLWILAVVLTAVIVIYQRATGPTYPVRGNVEIAGEKIKFRLLRSSGGYDDAAIEIRTGNREIEGSIRYKRYKTDDEWTETPMVYEDGTITGFLPLQPPAGKLAYYVKLSYKGEEYELTEDKVLIRFTGPVPLLILAPHILFMFIALLFSTRTGLEVLSRGKQAFNYALVTIIALFIGGLILGPIVQNLAFGDYWTGWPFGNDLTDNKTIVAFLFWAIAVYRLYKNPQNRGWALVAAIVLLAIYLIPHSVLGSEYDYAAGEVTTGNQ
jgi:hypothetical protein